MADLTKRKAGFNINILYSAYHQELPCRIMHSCHRNQFSIYHTNISMREQPLHELDSHLVATVNSSEVSITTNYYKCISDIISSSRKVQTCTRLCGTSNYGCSLAAARINPDSHNSVLLCLWYTPGAAR